MKVGLCTLVIGACSSAAAGLTSAAGRSALGLTGTVTPDGAGEPGAQTPTSAPATTNPADQQVFVEGDSLTVGVSSTLPVLLAEAGWTATIDAQVGRDTPTGIAMLSERTSEIGGTLVVALGTNDPPDPVAFAANIDHVMQIALGRRVIWVSVARSGWDSLDRALFAAQARWSNLRVIDWRPVIAAHPDMEAADGIHLTDAGYQLRAEFIAAAIMSQA